MTCNALWVSLGLFEQQFYKFNIIFGTKKYDGNKINNSDSCFHILCTVFVIVLLV